MTTPRTTELAPRLLGALALALLLAACGGGGSSGTTGGGGAPPGGGVPPPAEPPPGGGGSGGTPPGTGQDPVDLGIDRSGIIYLSISSFGSVVAGGVTYDVSEADILLNGQAVTQTELAPGDVALIVGDINEDGRTGRARQLRVDDLLRGTVASVDRSAGVFSLLSQRVVIVPDTVFGAGLSPRDIEGIDQGARLTVRGFVAADGRVVASRIEPASLPGERVTGFVAAVDVASFRLDLNGLMVDFGAAQLEGFPDGAPYPGAFVAIDGNVAGNMLVATRLSFLSRRSDEVCEGLEAACSGELEGYVSRFNSTSDFDVDGFPAAVHGETAYVGGTLADLAPDAKLRVRGDFDEAGRLRATEVVFDDDLRPIGVEAPIQSIDQAQGLVRLLGIPVRIDGRTRFEESARRNPSLADLRVGDYLELVGRELADDPARVLATRIEREDPDEEVELRGFVEAIDAPEFTVLGVTVRTTASTEFEIGDDDLSQEAFFHRLRIGDLVDIEGRQVGESIILAEEVEID